MAYTPRMTPEEALNVRGDVAQEIHTTPTPPKGVETLASATNN